MNIAVIGAGYVGLMTGACFAMLLAGRPSKCYMTRVVAFKGSECRRWRKVREAPAPTYIYSTSSLPEELA